VVNAALHESVVLGEETERLQLLPSEQQRQDFGEPLLLGSYAFRAWHF
jgi:hypothetical protein